VRDYYKILGVSPGAENKDIKSAFRRLARQCHPDLNECCDNQLFIDIKDAYDTLGDEDRRREYDQQMRREKLRRTIPIEPLRRAPETWAGRRTHPYEELNLAALLDQLVQEFLEADDVVPHYRTTRRSRSPIEDLHSRSMSGARGNDPNGLASLIEEILELFSRQGWFRW
jgi:curved DNA-binding protein CbpA